ncbi:Cuticlin-1 [Trichinella pseudospiralis]|uniref:Cuticlin-1 n=1 Tax=Trichinella pseudospiralis TaxID=6337 RepID=A0A0V1K4M7_TRIPS|nr:Cuticlin-1 [Trichinella pseudospiralis]KRZ42186.1 Cuticlin-1 [Trichinella pseudospiralis]
MIIVTFILSNSLFLLLHYCLQLLIEPLASAILLENGLIGEPAIECHPNAVQVTFQTENPFQGHVYVRGHYENEDCRRDYANGKDTIVVTQVHFSRCGVRRQRTTNPKGLSMITTLIITFHRTFVTATDRAFNVQCFYMEEDKIVTQNMDVSGIPTSDLDMNPPEPTCSYHVLRGGRAGVVVSHGKVGDPVYHRWACIYPMPVALWMMEKENCSMSLMKMGNCSKDIMILPDLIYLNDMEAGIDTTIFKFADKPHVYFTCQVRLSIKRENKNQICQKPTCSGTGRMRVTRRVKLPTRFSDALNSTSATMKKNVDIDLMASPIVVLDIEDRFPKMSTLDTAAMGDHEFIKKENLNINSSFSQNICMLPMAFNIFISTLIILVLLLLTFVAYVITQFRTYTPQY